ncbi:MAG: ABC transporter ATP-binding protein, partial [Treponema sp.]|nr:ABC transporter ATP-binding protein [Treponema sp.]
MIELIDFSKSYSRNKKNIVQNVSLKADKGSVTGLLGLNGAGKTTIIKALCALHFADSGKIIVTRDGRKYNAENNTEAVKKSIGYVPEQPELPGFLTVREYLLFVQKLYDVQKENQKSLFEKTTAECMLESALEKRIGTLSKGFKQRVCLAAALIHNPENLILDEPVNGLDPAQIIQFRKIIKHAAETKTVLLSTHLMQEVQALCTKIYIISDGKISAEGTAEQIMNC